MEQIMRAQTKEEWERELVGVIEDVDRMDVRDPAEALKLALGARGVRQPRVVWVQKRQDGPHLPFSAEGFVHEVDGSEREFSMSLDFGSIEFRWVD